MILEELANRIKQSTAPLKNNDQRMLSRTMHVVLSPSLFYVKEWYTNWFPFSDSEVDSIYPWVLYDSEDSLESELLKALRTSFDVKTSSGLIDKKYSISDTANQVFVIADLTEKGAYKKLTEFLDSFEKIIGQINLANIPIHLIGIFVLRKISSDEKGAENVLSAYDFNDCMNLSKMKLDRLFLLDISNPSGAIISDPNDFTYLIGHLIFYLRQKSVEIEKLESVDQYSDWLKRNSPKDGKVTGFSGISEVLPIDRLMEVAIVNRAVDVLDEAFLGDYNDKKLNNIVAGTISKTHLESYGSLSHWLSNNKKILKNDPFADDTVNNDIDSRLRHILSLMPLRVIPEYFENINSSFTAYSLQSINILTRVCNQYSAEFLYILKNAINHIMTNDCGSAKLAKSFLEQIAVCLGDILNNDFVPGKYDDPEIKISSLKRLISTGPSCSAVFVRTFLLALIFVFAALGISELSFAHRIVLYFCSGISVLSGWLYWKARKARIDRAIIELQLSMRSKWASMMKKNIYDVIKRQTPLLVDIVTDLVADAEYVKERLEELLIIFRDEYKVETPDNSVFWHSVLGQKDTALSYVNRISFNMDQVTQDYIIADEPFEFWNRIQKPGSGQPNSWEWGILEKAGLRIFPFAENLANLTLCDVLRDHPDDVGPILEKMRDFSSPFMVLTPGCYGGSARAVVQIHPAGCSDIASRIKNAIGGHFRDQSEGTSSIYRISLLSILEDIEFSSISAGEH